MHLTKAQKHKNKLNHISNWKKTKQNKKGTAEAMHTMPNISVLAPTLQDLLVWFVPIINHLKRLATHYSHRVILFAHRNTLVRKTTICLPAMWAHKLEIAVFFLSLFLSHLFGILRLVNSICSVFRPPFVEVKRFFLQIWQPQIGTTSVNPAKSHHHAANTQTNRRMQTMKPYSNLTFNLLIRDCVIEVKVDLTA